MSNPSSSSNIYSLIYRRLHWALAAIIISLLMAGLQFNFNISEGYRIHGLKAHSSFGTIALLVALFFIVKRFVLRKPTPEPTLPPFKRLMARVVQLGLYTLAVVIPVSGILCALYSKYPVYLFGLFDLSSLQVSSEATFIYLRAIHMWATRLAMLLVACHAGAALYHHFVEKDQVLKSMVASDPLLSRVWKLMRLGKES